MTSHHALSNCVKLYRSLVLGQHTDSVLRSASEKNPQKIWVQSSVVWAHLDTVDTQCRCNYIIMSSTLK